MSKIEQMKAQALAKVQAKMQAAKEAAAEKLYSSEAFIELLVAQKVSEEASEKLQELVAQCESIVEDQPIYSKVLRKHRNFNQQKRYGFGLLVASLTGLLSGIQYSAQEHKSQMLLITNLSESLIERTLEAFGSLPYYSTNNEVIVEGAVGNAAEAIQCLQLLSASLEIALPTDKITQEAFDLQHGIARAKAETASNEAAATANLQAQFVL